MPVGSRLKGTVLKFWGGYLTVPVQTVFIFSMGLFPAVGGEAGFQLAQRLEAMTFIFAEPAFGEFVQGCGIEVMQFFAPAPDRGDQIRRLEQGQMFGHRLAGHVEMPAQCANVLPVIRQQLIEQLPAAFIGQRFEQGIQHAKHATTGWLRVKRGNATG